MLRSGATIISERYGEQRVRIPKRIVREEIYEKVIRIPEKRIEEETIEEEAVIREKIVELAKPIIREKIVEVPEYEYRDKIIEVPEVIVQERVHQVPKIEIVERVREVPKYITQEKIVEVPEVHYKDVPIVKRVEVPEIREEVVYKERPVTQYIDKPVPQVVEVPRPYDVPLKVPNTIAVDARYRYEVPKIEAVRRQQKYPVYIPKFVEVPLPRAYVDDQTAEEIGELRQQIAQLAQSNVPLSLAGIEGLAEDIRRRNLVNNVQKNIQNNGLNLLTEKFNQGRLQIVHGNPDPYVVRNEMQPIEGRYTTGAKVLTRGGATEHGSRRARTRTSRRKHHNRPSSKPAKYSCPLQMEWMTPRQNKYTDSGASRTKGIFCGAEPPRRRDTWAYAKPPSNRRLRSSSTDSSLSYCSSCSECYDDLTSHHHHQNRVYATLF